MRTMFQTVVPVYRDLTRNVTRELYHDLTEQRANKTFFPMDPRNKEIINSKGFEKICP